jgi:hypothetical protein
VVVVFAHDAPLVIVRERPLYEPGAPILTGELCFFRARGHSGQNVRLRAGQAKGSVLGSQKRP